MSTFNQKLQISIGSGILFALMNSPLLLQHLGDTVFNRSTNCLTDTGVIVQVILFAVITFLSMGKIKDVLTKAGHTTYGSLIFFFVANPVTYRVVSNLLGGGLASGAGCPTDMGIIVHTLVYIAILTGVMYFP